MTITFVGQQDNSYKFQLSNLSSHGVTAFAVHLVPGGVSFSVGDNAGPVVKAKGSKDLRFETSAVTGGDVVVQAAVFDDESFEGEDRVAASLVARQIGNQAEYDRIVPVVEGVLSSHADDAAKTLLIRRKLGELPVNVDPPVIRTFNRWFPGLADCNRRYMRRMKGAMVAEKEWVAGSMEQFAHGAAPGKPALEQWWTTTKEHLAGFGCKGCAEQASLPKTPSTQASFPGCAAGADEEFVVFTAELIDDEFGMGADPNDDPGLAAEDMAAAELEDKVHANPRPPQPPPRVVAADSRARTSLPEKPETGPAPLPAASAVHPLMPPTGVAFMTSPSGKFLLYRTHISGPATDYILYPLFFRDIAQLGDNALYEEVEIIGSVTRVTGNDPPAGGIDDAKIKILREVALACNQDLADLYKKQASLYSLYNKDYPPGWLFTAPPSPALQRLTERRISIVNQYVARLHARLGDASFSKLEAFVYKLYRAAPGKAVTLPMPEDAYYGSFLRYIYMLTQIPAAKQEVAKRQEELLVAGLGKDAWTTLNKIALSYHEVSTEQEARMRKLQAIPNLNFAPRPGAIAQGASAGTPLPLPTGLAQAGAGVAMPQPQAAAGSLQPVQPMAAAGGSARGSGMNGQSPELTKLFNEQKLSLVEHIAQLQAGLGQASFRKLDRYVHRLYAKAGREIFVAKGAQPGAASAQPNTPPSAAQ